MAIAHRATGVALFSDATMSPVVPTAQVTGDMMLLLAGGKPYNRTATVSTTGWTSLGTFADSNIAAGVDTGSMIVQAWYKEATSDTEADPTITEGATVWNVMGGIVVVFSKGVSDAWVVPLMSGGGDTFADTAFSAAASEVAFGSSFNVGDHYLSFAAFRSDAATPCSSHLTVAGSGMTLSHTHDPATDPETTTGGDMGMCVTRSVHTSGAWTFGSLALQATLAASHTGAAATVRLRVTSSGGTPGPATLLSTRRLAANRYLTSR